jgi:hypothetical protein
MDWNMHLAVLVLVLTNGLILQKQQSTGEIRLESWLLRIPLPPRISCATIPDIGGISR